MTSATLSSGSISIQTNIAAKSASGFPWVSTLCTARAPWRQAGQVGETKATSRGNPLLSLNAQLSGRMECESEVTTCTGISTPAYDCSQLAARWSWATKSCALWGMLPGGSRRALPHSTASWGEGDSRCSGAIQFKQVGPFSYRVAVPCSPCTPSMHSIMPRCRLSCLNQLRTASPISASFHSASCRS